MPIICTVNLSAFVYAEVTYCYFSQIINWIAPTVNFTFPNAGLDLSMVRVWRQKREINNNVDYFS